MNEIETLCIMLAVLAGGLLLQYLILTVRIAAPARPAERMALLPDGRVQLTSRCGRSYAFRPDEMWSVRGRDQIGGLSEVIVDLADRRVVVGVSSGAMQQDMVQRLTRLRLDPI